MSRVTRLILLAVFATVTVPCVADAVPCGRGHAYCKQHFHRQHKPRSPAYYNAPHVP